MGENRVLVVGAGALGLTAGYHLARAGAQVDFLVRPHRRAQLARPQRLYRIDGDSVETWGDYEVVEDPAALAGRSYSLVLLTLDGATCRTAEGSATVAEVGRHLAASRARLLVCGVGLGLYEHVRDTARWPEERLLEGTMGMLAYAPGAPGAPRPAGAGEAHDRADLAYRRGPSGADFLVAGRPRRAAKALAALLAQGGLAVRVMSVRLYRMFTSAFCTQVAACDLAGWPATVEEVIASSGWPLAARAQREILRLPQFGWPGKLAALAMGERRQAALFAATAQGAAPLDYMAFMRFHHGVKVRAQNQRILADCLAAGERAGLTMPAGRELLDRWRALPAPA